MYREDLEAALARADAAERELGELRQAGGAEHARAEALEQELGKLKQEIARLRKAAPTPTLPRARPARVAAYGSRSPAVKVTVGVAGVAAFAGLIAAMIFGQRACVRHRAMTNPGELYAMHVVHTRDGKARLLVVNSAQNLRSSANTNRWRIDLVDPKTGQRLQRKIFQDAGRRNRPEILPAGPGRFWCDLHGSFVGQVQLIEQCDVDTLEVVVSSKDLVAKNPSLAGGFSYSPEVDLGTGDLVTTTKAAETVIISAADLTMRPFHNSKDLVCLDNDVGGGRALRRSLEAAYHGPGQLAFDEGGNCATLRRSGDPALTAVLETLPRLAGLGQTQDGATRATSAAGPYSFAAVEGGPRESLFITTGAYGSGHALSDASYIQPELLAGYALPREAIVLPGNAGVIMVHHDSLDQNGAKVLLSRLGLDDGRARWTLTEPPSEVKMGYLDGDTVMVGLRVYSGRSVLLGIAWQDGRELWRYAM